MSDSYFGGSILTSSRCCFLFHSGVIDIGTLSSDIANGVREQFLPDIYATIINATFDWSIFCWSTHHLSSNTPTTNIGWSILWRRWWLFERCQLKCDSWNVIRYYILFTRNERRHMAYSTIFIQRISRRPIYSAQRACTMTPSLTIGWLVWEVWFILWDGVLKNSLCCFCSESAIIDISNISIGTSSLE